MRGMNSDAATPPSWQFDETGHTGKDFASPAVVEAYDARHRRFRDVDRENEEIIAAIGLQERHSVADFGCGTGEFAVRAAGRCAKVYAVDISPAMLKAVEWKVRARGLSNVVCRLGGFLTYVHDGEPLDAIVTGLALHHLPDFWKQKALRRLNSMLGAGGRLFLMDVVFSGEDCERDIEAWIAALGRQAGPEMVADVSRHVRQEHSTFAWVMEGLIERAGFRIDRKEYAGGVTAGYLCTKSA
jgi:putative AdoMet-dependent methyltransferase